MRFGKIQTQYGVIFPDSTELRTANIPYSNQGHPQIATMKEALDTLFLRPLELTNVRKFVGLVGDGSSSNFIVLHNLGTEDVLLDVRYVTSKEKAEVFDSVIDLNRIRLVFSTPPLVEEFKVVVIG